MEWPVQLQGPPSCFWVGSVVGERESPPVFVLPASSALAVALGGLTCLPPQGHPSVCQGDILSGCSLRNRSWKECWVPFPRTQGSPGGGTVVSWGQRTCPEMLLDLKNIEHSASVDYRAMGSEQDHSILEREEEALSWGREVCCKLMGFLKLQVWLGFMSGIT